MTTLVIALPPTDGGLLAWWRIENDSVVATGSDFVGVEPGDDRIVALAPAASVTLHRASLPDLASRQAAVAARLMALENSAATGELLHVATGPRDADGGLDIAVVAAATMTRWVAELGGLGIDPAAIVPAMTVLPRPEEGFVAATIGPETIYRDATSAFADPELAPLLIGDAAVTTLSPAEVESALVAAAAAPPLDLRQGPFGRRRGVTLDWRALRRAAVLVGLILLASLAISLVRIARLRHEAAMLDAQTVALGQRLSPTVADPEQAEAIANARLTAASLGGRGFAPAAAQLFAALRDTPAVTVTQLASSAGGLRATLAAPRADQTDAVLAALRASGYAVTADPPQNQGGQSATPITIAAP